MKWYVMNVFSGKEKSIKEKIEKRLETIGMSHLVSQILIPREKTFQVRNGKKVKTEKNYFPGYMMIECEMNGELMKNIKNVTGVITFLTNPDGQPIPMRENEVANLLGKVDELSQTDAVASISFVEGQHVTINDGPFQSMNGVVSKVITDKCRIIVDVSIFNRKTPVELSYEQVNSI